MNCSNCGKKLERLEVGDNVANVDLRLKGDVYVPMLTLFDYEEFKCPECGCEYHEEDHVPVSKNLVYVVVSTLHKPVLIDLEQVSKDEKKE